MSISKDNGASCMDLSSSPGARLDMLWRDPWDCLNVHTGRDSLLARPPDVIIKGMWCVMLGICLAKEVANNWQVRTTFTGSHWMSLINNNSIIGQVWLNKFLLINLSQISTRTEFHCQQGKLIITDIQSWRYISSRHKVRVMEPLHDLYLLLPTLSVMGIQFQTTPFQSNLFLCNLQHDHR